MTEDTRPNWDDYFINIAAEVAQRATCPRAKVGAVIVKDNRIISTGYNGAPAGEPHCFEEGCIIEDNHCIRVIHAEVNAVCAAAKFGLSVDGADLYYWDSKMRPESCHNCIQVMKAAGIKNIISMGSGANCGFIRSTPLKKLQ
jgi:dCMP deaminase